jgi:hypothetical protein
MFFPRTAPGWARIVESQTECRGGLLLTPPPRSDRGCAEPDFVRSPVSTAGVSVVSVGPCRKHWAHFSYNPFNDRS